MLDFDITASDPDLVMIDPEGYISAIKIGTVVITCTLKSNPAISGSITLQIKPKSPMLSLKTKYVFVNNQFEISDMTYDDFSIFNIEYDSEMVEYNNGFKALKSGTTKIKFSFIDYPEIYDEIEVTIFEVEPLLSISSNQFVLGSTTRIDIANYDLEDINIEALEDGKVSFDGRLITGLKTGEVTIKVSLKNDPTIFSTLDLEITPILPDLKLSSENILIGGKTRLIIDNLSELEYTNLEDYKVEILLSSLFITIDNDWFVEGKSLGTAEIKVTAKNNDQIFATIKVNVVETSDQRDASDEIAAGPLVLSIDNFDGYIHAGEMTYIKIDGAKDLTKYKWTTSDSEVLTVYEDGRIICIKEGSAYVIAYNSDNKEVTGRIYIKVYGEPNVNYVDRLIKMAESQLGYVEGPDNDTKYGDWYGIPNGAWCAMFVSWCAYQVGISTDVIVKYASCKVGREWFESNGRFGYKESYTPKAGDIIFFLNDGASHTGIVINCDGNKVYTIEGNTSNMCAKRSYDLNWHTITGYGIPNYPAFDGEVSGGDIGGSTDGGDSSTT
ncbi:MAG: CHAP domain-containing protein [Bacilli bacterium]|nr:CHAP domain-containing protein [Bacilli bacterium]